MFFSTLSTDSLLQTHPVGQDFERWQRLLDVTASLVGLLASLPILAACALWIKCCDGGPVIYSQWRVGKDGWLFRIHKLRTMTKSAEASGAQYARPADDRVLPGCAWMRRSHVDELPQFWNILCGQMSLVGPRPERPEMVERLRMFIPSMDRRLDARPGLTGLAQIRKGYTKDIAGARRKLAYDLRYLRQRSVWTELKLIIATVPKLWDTTAM